MIEAFGWTIASVGAASCTAAVILEIIKKDKIYMLLMKISAGIFGVGGVILAISIL